jgi:hypothetical protein
MKMECYCLMLQELLLIQGLENQMKKYHINIRDVARREYLLKGPCQPICHIKFGPRLW